MFSYQIRLYDAKTPGRNDARRNDPWYAKTPDAMTGGEQQKDRKGNVKVKGAGNIPLELSSLCHNVPSLCIKVKEVSNVRLVVIDKGNTKFHDLTHIISI